LFCLLARSLRSPRGAPLPGRRICGILKLMSLEVATPDQTRELLALKGR